MSPLCESLLTASALNGMESFYPLRLFVCGRCFLVQMEEYVSPLNIFSEYAYFSSYSASWLEHVGRYADRMIETVGLDASSQVIEVGSNDGYALSAFLRRGIPGLGIEPARNVAAAAQAKGVPTRVEFFGRESARRLVREGWQPALLFGKNVMAQVPDLNDFVGGLKILLAPQGVITIEFPHLMQLVEQNQFDTIYHEHFSYFSFSVVRDVFATHGLTVFDVEEYPTHGGSLRIYARHSEACASPSERVTEMVTRESAAGVRSVDYYEGFEARVMESKRDLLGFLIAARREGKTVVGYGAPGKGNTLLNYCGIRTDFLDYTVDRNPYKQGRFLPGTHIPIFAPEKIDDTKPDYVLILPWNLKEEVMEQMTRIRSWGGRFVTPIPAVRVYE